MSFELLWEPKGVVIRFYGTVGMFDPEQATAAYTRDIRFDELKFVIADYSGISGCEALPKDIEAVGAMDIGAMRTNPLMRKAVVTTSPEVIAMAEHHQEALGVQMPTRIFPTMAEARAWLHSSAKNY